MQLIFCYHVCLVSKKEEFYRYTKYCMYSWKRCWLAFNKKAFFTSQHCWFSVDKSYYVINLLGLLQNGVATSILLSYLYFISLLSLYKRVVLTLKGYKKCCMYVLKKQQHWLVFKRLQFFLITLLILSGQVILFYQSVWSFKKGSCN